MKTLLISTFVLVILLTGCHKNGDDSRPQSIDPIKYLFISTMDDNPNLPNYPLTSLNAYNPDLTLKWRKQDMGNGDFSGLWVEGGVVYASLGYNIYALNYSTGAEIWSKKPGQDWIYNFAKKDDTLYCSTAERYSGGSLAITAYRASTGAFIWRKPLNTAFGAGYLTVDGNTLYYGAATSVTGNLLYAMDLTTQNIKWSLPIGANINGAYSKPVITSTKLYMITGGGTLLAVDKSNGSVLWSKPNQKLQPVLANNNKVVISASYSLDEMYGFNADNGNQLWIQKGSQSTGLNVFYLSGDGQDCYFTGSDGPPCLIKQNATTGTTIWRQSYVNHFLTYPISAGGKTYMLKAIFGRSYATTLMSFDASDGTFLDSLRMPYRYAGIPSIITSSGKYIQPWISL